MMSSADLKTPDAAPQSWVDRLPLAFRPYLRLMRADRPVGVWLLYLPCLWGTIIARPAGTPLDDIIRLAVLFLIGAFAMRSAGCIYNDIIDKDLDASVARTANRPLAAGTVSLTEAWILLVALCFLGLSVLVLLPPLAIGVALCSLLLVAGYPFMKRITWWPQAWLGLTFNWGALVGGASIARDLPPSVILAYLAGVFWTLGYDTIYAHQDREDDALVGIKSSARRLGGSSASGVAIFYGLTIFLLAIGLMTEDVLIWLVLLTPGAAHFAWQVRSLDIDDGGLCLRIFKSNVVAGALLLIPMLAA